MTKTSFWASGFLTAFVFGALAGGSGCKPDDEVCEEYDCQVGELYGCKPLTGSWKYDCRDSDAVKWCHDLGGGRRGPVRIPCENYGGDGTDDGGTETGAGAPPWDPSASVIIDPASGQYLIDESFVQVLKGDPALLTLDSARVNMLSTGYYELENVTQGDLAGEMGLQSGDVLVSVNGHDLSSMDDMVEAYYSLESATIFTLAILRKGKSMTLVYQVVEFI